MFFYLVIMIVDNVLLIMFIYVCIIFKIWLILIINVKFCVGKFMVFNVVNKIMIEVFGIVVIFLDVIINVNINIICFDNVKCILYICVMNNVVIDW